MLKEAKKKKDFEEYDEFNAEDQLQQLISFTADKVGGREEAQAESRTHLQKLRQLRYKKEKTNSSEKCINWRAA